jgi:hypothetical protein
MLSLEKEYVRVWSCLFIYKHWRDSECSELYFSFIIPLCREVIN